MKIIVSFLLAFLVITVVSGDVFAQERTIILLRHAEKDLTDPKNPNPELSTEGKQRAQNLLNVVKKYDPEMIYSSMFTRTKGTVRPLAQPAAAVRR